LSALDAARFEGLDRTGVDQRLAEFLVRAGQVVRLGRERYYLSAHRDAMVAIARDLLRTGDVSPADFRERLGISRKYLMPFLEWLDQEGYSVRSGDGRRAGHRLEHA
jgi:selenocysteine-specific elongation factor